MLREILEISDFMPESLQDEIEEFVFNSDLFTWYYNNEIATKLTENQEIADKIRALKQVKDAYQFTHTMCRSNKKTSVFYEFFRTILRFLEYKLNFRVIKIHRMKTNFNTPLPNYKEGDIFKIHSDHKSSECFSFIYYIHDTDGDTIFYDDDLNELKRASPKKGTGILFKSKMLHTGSPPVNSGKRIMVNYVFEVDQKDNMNWG